MTQRIFLLFCFALGVGTPLRAQILNVEDVRARRDSTDAWVGNVGLDFVLNNRSATPTNPVQFINIGLRANGARYGDQSALMFLNVLNYSAITGNQFIRTGYSHLRFNYLYRQPLSYEAYVQGQYDLGRGLQARWLGGVGLRTDLLRNDKLELHLGVGAMYEYEHWRALQDGANVYVNYLKSSNYLSFTWDPSKMVHVHITSYYQVGYDQPLTLWRHRLSTDALLQVRLSERVAFRVALDASYESAPIIPIYPWVYTLTNGIAVAF